MMRDNEKSKAQLIKDLSALRKQVNGFEDLQVERNNVEKNITERKRAEQSLLESEERYRTLSEAAFEGIVISENGKLVMANKVFAKMFGYKLHEVIGLSPVEMTTPESAEIIMKNIQFSYAKPYEVIGVKKDGSTFDMEIIGKDCLFKGRKARVAALRDITDRKQAAVELSKSEAKFRVLAETTSAAIFIFQRNRMRYVNPAASIITGFTQDELLKMNFWEVIHTDFRSLVKERGFARQRGKKSRKRFEVKILTKNGHERWVDFTANATEFNQKPAVLGTAVDITEIKLAEKKLENSLSLLRSTLESTADGILVVDKEGKIVSFNQKFLKMWHIPDSIIASHDDDKAIAFVLNQLKEPEDFLTQVRRLYNEPEAKSFDILSFKDGRIFERYSLAQRIGDKIVGRVWSFHDITERKQIEAQLLQSQKMETIGTLAGGVAHDFNNILTAIVGNAELGMQRLDSNHYSYDDLFEIKKAAIKASDLTNQLLSFSRRQILKKQSFNLNKVVEDLLKMLKRILGEDIELKTELAPSLPQVFADKGQIHQVLMNLFTNARDAMPSGGKLLLETRQLSEPHNGDRFNNKTYLQLSVTDTGMGMGRELQAHIFEPFFTTKKLGKGTGLGLAVVYGIVKQHDGHLEVESEIDKGTTFRIFLPAATKRQQKKRPQVERRLNTLQGGNETILIVEDEEIVRNVAARIVKGLGYKVLLAKNGEEAMEIFNAEKNSVDLVVMDVVMPKESGPEIYKKMNSINPDLPVLFVTGYDAGYKVLNLTQGFNQALIALLQKPYSKEILGQEIRELLDK